MVDFLSNLGVSDNLPGALKYQTHHTTDKGPFIREREKYFTIASNVIVATEARNIFTLNKTGKDVLKLKRDGR